MKPALLSRRDFFPYLGGLAGLMVSWPSLAASAPERTLAMRNLHTGEFLRATYWADGGVQAAELDALNRLLRDHRSGEVYPVDTGLLDILWKLQRVVGSERPYEVISGYRSPATNAKLSAKSRGVAKRSLHMQGRAIDVRLPGTRTLELKKAAIALKRGGVGYYAESDFVHLDTGRFRTW
jgi:uncharacterized protein YcbK (DUF882 family)